MSDEPNLQTMTREIRVQRPVETVGRVRWFSPEKGYGFIAPDDGGEDLFVRHSSIQVDGFRRLDAGQRVVFHRASDDRGPRAVQVRPLDE